MSEWMQKQLGEICDVRDGTHDSPKQHPVGKPLVTSKNLKKGAIDLENTYLISEADFQQINRRSKVDQYDILFSMIGTVGEMAIVKEEPDFAIKNVGLFKCNRDYELSKWIFYYMKSSAANEEIQAAMKGSTQAYIALGDLRKFPIAFPPDAEQKAIATVLGSLDDKIDLLHRQNQTLEAMAASLFRQWFVEEAQEDWEEVTLSDVTTRITDGAHASPATVEVGLPMASVKDMYQWGINTESCRQISQDDFDELIRTDCRPLKNDILIAKDGSYLKHVFVAEEDMDVVILSSIAILRPNGKYHPLLLATFLKLESTKEGLANIVTGAVIPRIVLKDFRKYKLLLPPQPLQDQAIATIQPIYEKCWENDRQIRTLEKLRDNLLPKLMSGEMRIET